VGNIEVSSLKPSTHLRVQPLYVTPRRKPWRILPSAQLGEEAEVDAQHRDESGLALGGRELPKKTTACHGSRYAQQQHAGSPRRPILPRVVHALAKGQQAQRPNRKFKDPFSTSGNLSLSLPTAGGG